MQGIVGAIAGIGLIVNGDRPIGTDREVVDNLLEIGAMVFAVALGKIQPRGGFTRHVPAALHRSRVVVQLAQVNPGGLDHPQRDIGHHRCPVRRIELIQRPGETVISIEILGGISRGPQQPTVEFCDPFRQFIERLPTASDIPYQYQQRIERRHGFVAMGFDVAEQYLAQSQPFDHRLQDRDFANAFADQLFHRFVCRPDCH